MNCAICGKVHRGQLWNELADNKQYIWLGPPSRQMMIAHGVVLLLEEAEEIIEALNCRLVLGPASKYYDLSDDQRSALAWLAKARVE